MRSSGVRLLALAGLLVLLVSSATGSVPSAEARVRDEPTIQLTARQCPPGMSASGLDINACQPITTGFDVVIKSIDGTQSDVSLVDATLDGTTFSWKVRPSDREMDSWGLSQTALPPGSTAYIVTGESVETVKGRSYDFRFTTTEDNPVRNLDLMVFSPGVDGVVIPPAATEPAPTETPAPTVVPETPDLPESNAVATDSGQPPMRTEKVEVANADPAPNSTLSNAAQAEVLGGPAPMRMAASTNAIIVATLEQGDQVTLMSGAMQSENAFWYQVSTDKNVVGWLEAVYLSVPQTMTSLEPAPPVAEADPPISKKPESEPAAAAAESAAAAPALAPGDRAVVSDPPLILRAAPDPNADAIDKLAEGQGMRIESGPVSAGGYTWYEVTLLPAEAVSGYVAGEFLQAVEFVGGDQIFVSDGVVNLRSKAGTNGDVVAKLADGETGTVLSGPERADGYDWYQIAFENGSMGWAASDFVTLGSGTSSTVVESAPVPTGTNGALFSAGSRLVVVDPPVNVRSAPDLGNNVLVQLEEGESVTVITFAQSDDAGDWYQVTTGGQTGYVVGAFFETAFVAGEQVVVFDGPIYLRGGPRADGAILASVQENEVLTVLETAPVQQDGYIWIQVVTESGAKGYVATDFLAPAA